MLAENDWPKAMGGTWGYGILGLPRLNPTSDMNWPKVTQRTFMRKAGLELAVFLVSSQVL